MRTIKLADVVIQMHVRDEYSWQRVCLYFKRNY